jgi:thiaminase
MAYKNLFAGAAEPSASLLRGMVTLWATEVCYLMAWRWAKGQLVQEGGDVMREVFIPNWSSNEFAEFVKRLGDLVDEMGRAVEKEEVRECEEVWEMVVWAEKGFWPDV